MIFPANRCVLPKLWIHIVRNNKRDHNLTFMRVPENDFNIRIAKDIFEINLKIGMIVLYNINQWKGIIFSQ